MRRSRPSAQRSAAIAAGRRALTCDASRVRFVVTAKRRLRRRRTHDATSLDEVARAIVADGKGILAADETVRHDHQAAGGARHRIDRRTAAAPTARCSSARPTSPSSSAASSCRTRRSGSRARPASRWSSCSSTQGIIPGIKVDAGAHAAGRRAGRARHRGARRAARPARGVPRSSGARFAKWRAVIVIGDGLPTASVRPRQRARARALRRALPGAGARPHRRARGADGRGAHRSSAAKR